MVISSELSELKELIQNRKNVAAFIGAGCSKVLNIPLWDDLLIALNDEFKFYDNNDELKKAIKRDDYPLVATNILNKAGDNKKKYYEIIKQNVLPKACFFSSLHMNVINVFDLIITTNYDMSFEEAYNSINRIPGIKKVEYKKQTIEELTALSIGNGKHICHIHGDIDNANFVLSYESYKEQYDKPTSRLGDFIRPILREYSLVFIGFSFNDSFFVSFLQDAVQQINDECKKTGKKSPSHFVIISRDDYKLSFTEQEIISNRNMKIEMLVEAGILLEKKATESSKTLFCFSDEANELINDSNKFFDEEKKTLFDMINVVGLRKIKIKLLNDLNIKPIVFDANNYLEIEDILMKLGERPEAKDSYNPN